MKRLLIALLAIVGAGDVYAADTDKTLVSWVTLADQNLRSGSVLTIQQGDQFDGIVFAELSPRKWMAGSDRFSRTEKKQDAFPVETADVRTLIQMAIVYQGDRITIYRNAEIYYSYQAKNIDLLSSEENYAVFGLRHVGGDGSIGGSIEDARVYDRALSADELQSLKPNQASTIRPYAWWDFEGDKVVDRAGQFSYSKSAGNVELADGKLILGRNAVLISARSEQASSASVAAAIKRFPPPYKPMTPAMPASIPDTWLTYHLAHPGPDRAIPADPNCAIYYKGRYHLFYIHQSHGHSFAHVSSTDMVHWKWHVTTLTPPKTGHGMFSGTAFLTRQGQPAIIYHGQGTNRNQIAFALDDDLDKWSQPVAVEPLTESGELAKMRHWDPDCWRIGDTYYAIGGGSHPTLAKSTDLSSWTFLGELFHPDFPADLGVEKGEDTSCANMFKIGDKWMLLCISHGLGCRYYLGDFKDGKYLPEHHAMMNWARWDFFAPESLLAPDGRRVMWAWCTPWVNNMQKVGRPVDFAPLMQGKIQPGIQSLPRELSLSKDGGLRIKPLRELEGLRTEKQLEKAITVKTNSSYLLKDITGDTMELEIVFEKPAAREFGVKVLCGKDGSQGFTIASGRDVNALTVGYIKPPFELTDGEDLKLRIFIDKSMIEVFANGRQAAVAWHEYEPRDLHVSLFSNGGDSTIKSVTAWNIKSIYDDAGSLR